MAKQEDFRYKKWRQEIYRRANYICQMCGCKDVKFHAHHVYSQHRHPHLKYVLENGLCLCGQCHLVRVHYNGETPSGAYDILKSLRTLALDRKALITYKKYHKVLNSDRKRRSDPGVSPLPESFAVFGIKIIY